MSLIHAPVHYAHRHAAVTWVTAQHMPLGMSNPRCCWSELLAHLPCPWPFTLHYIPGCSPGMCSNSFLFEGSNTHLHLNVCSVVSGVPHGYACGAEVYPSATLIVSLAKRHLSCASFMSDTHMIPGVLHTQSGMCVAPLKVCTPQRIGAGGSCLLSCPVPSSVPGLFQTFHMHVERPRRTLA